MYGDNPLASVVVTTGLAASGSTARSHALEAHLGVDPFDYGGLTGLGYASEVVLMTAGTWNGLVCVVPENGKNF